MCFQILAVKLVAKFTVCFQILAVKLVAKFVFKVLVTLVTPRGSMREVACFQPLAQLQCLCYTNFIAFQAHLTPHFVRNLNATLLDMFVGSHFETVYLLFVANLVIYLF